jgi:GNAT superfamily N-acetyltransferase
VRHRPAPNCVPYRAPEISVSGDPERRLRGCPITPTPRLSSIAGCWHRGGWGLAGWNVEPNQPEIIGPWFLWKLIVDQQHQHNGYRAAIVRLVADLVRAEGANELLTSYTEGPGDPGPFYRRLGFVPTGDGGINGEAILALGLHR